MPATKASLPRPRLTRPKHSPWESRMASWMIDLLPEPPRARWTSWASREVTSRLTGKYWRVESLMLPVRHYSWMLYSICRWLCLVPCMQTCLPVPWIPMVSGQHCNLYKPSLHQGKPQRSSQLQQVKHIIMYIPLPARATAETCLYEMTGKYCYSKLEIVVLLKEILCVRIPPILLTWWRLAGETQMYSAWELRKVAWLPELQDLVLYW